VNIDPQSPRIGAKVPLWMEFRTAPDAYRDADLLALMPVPGHVLEQGVLYAAIVTDGVRDTLGAPLTAPPAIQRLQAEAPAGAFETAALPLYQTLWQELENDEGLGRAHVVTATVFRTGTPAAPLLAAGARPKRLSFRHAVNYADFGTFRVVAGDVSMPQFQAGTPPFTAAGSGGFVFDRRGKPLVQRKEPVRVVVAVPAGVPMPATGWPIATCMHGTGGSALSFVNDQTAARLAAQGIASISFDQPLHGLRPGTPDDFYSPLNPIAFRDNTRQAALEGLYVHALAGRLHIPPALHVGPARFDRHARLFFGHSQGATVGPLVLAMATDIRGGVLSAGGGHLLLNILTREVPLLGTLTAKQLVEALLGAPMDVFHPALHLLQMGARRRTRSPTSTASGGTGPATR
jgi:predicted esterase